MTDLVIDNLYVSVDGYEVLKGLNLRVASGEIHAIMGPNGTGKSTLSYIISGHPSYKVDNGSIFFNGKDLLKMEIHERALAGIFLAFQYPVEIPGVTVSNFLKTCLNSQRKEAGLEEIDALEFLKLVKEKMKLFQIDPEMIKRPLNVGFSGGEKKRLEVLQMSILKPNLCVMDETDSGLDIDALKIVSNGINTMADKDRSFLIITHYQRLLEYIVPQYVHVLVDGKIVESGGKDLAQLLEEEGYGRFESI